MCLLIHSAKKKEEPMSELLEANIASGKLKAFGRTIDISCRVRNEINGLRSLTEPPLLSMPNEKPVMPRQFPKGLWQITDRPWPRVNPEKEPFFIPTDAFQELPVWTVIDGHYGEVTEEVTKDIGYGVHHSLYANTNGCLKVLNREDLLFLVKNINRCFDDKRSIFLKVT